MKSKLKWWLLFWLLVTKQACAQNTEYINRSWDFGIGIGFGEQSNPFVGADDVPGYFTLDVAIYGDRFFFDNGDVGFTLIDRSNFGLNVLANYSSERIYYSYFNDLGLIRSSVITGGSDNSLSVIPSNLFPSGGVSSAPPNMFRILELPDRDFAVNLGVELLWDTSVGQIQWHMAHDVSGAHDGFQVGIDYSHVWGHGRWVLKPNLGLIWKSSKLVDYYYGLDNQEAFFEFRYRGKSTTNLNVGMLLSYRINNKLSYVNHFKYTYLGSSIRNSPLINSNHTQSFFSGLYYRF